MIWLSMDIITSALGIMLRLVGHRVPLICQEQNLYILVAEERMAFYQEVRF